jgi:hypothetical protein
VSPGKPLDDNHAERWVIGEHPDGQVVEHVAVRKEMSLVRIAGATPGIAVDVRRAVATGPLRWT